MTTNKTAKLSVNVEGLISNLKLAFDSHLSVIKELAQNSRRSGSDRVEFHLDTYEGTLTVIDNGSGIQNMNDLFTVAQSGWPSDVIEQEQPFGMGFLSALFLADWIKVESCGQRLCTSTKAITSFEEVSIQPMIDNGVTTVVLKGEGVLELAKSIENHYTYYSDNRLISGVEKIFSGFPIEVVFNNVTIKRPHAIGNYNPSKYGQWFNTIEGDSYISLDISEDKGLDFGVGWKAFYQGFPIHTNDSFFDRSNVIHLSTSEFKAIMPDRHKLIDEDVQSVRISGLMNDIKKEMLFDILSAKKLPNESLDYEKVILSSYKVLKEFEQLKVFNDFNRLPSDVLSHFTGDCYPVHSSNEDHIGDNWTESNSQLPKEIFSSGDVVVFNEEEPELDDSSCYRFAMYLAINDAYFISSDLDDEHWIYQYAHKAYDEENGDFLIQVNVENEIDSKVSMSNGAWCNVRLCESYTLTHPVLGATSVNDTGFLYNPNHNKTDWTEGSLVIPMNENSGDVLLQYNSYQGEFNYNETDKENDIDSFESWLIKERLSDDHVALLSNLMTDIPRTNQQLIGKSFTVVFGRDGMIIDEIEAA